MKKIILISIIFLSALTVNAQRNEFSFGASTNQREELLQTINKEVLTTEIKIEKLQAESQKLWSKISRVSSDDSKRDREEIRKNDEKIQSLEEYLISLSKSKERIISNSVDSEGSIYSRGMNPAKVKAGAEALTMLSFIKNSQSNEQALKAIIINKGYYEANVKISLGGFYSNEFNLERRVGVQEINLPTFGDYIITVTKGTGNGSGSTTLIKACRPGITYLYKNIKYDLMVTILH